ncbi:inositol 1,4,5-trisphosphate receptor-interacting protein-like 1 [Tachyglossus aculeatus]|uniref:inositol 1,4,5-trisphosphate receptor-interacting protein-like 1 n=1 Tax=Tachyglossus aculeatus TaxID=9261 RepID=UPI0018F64B00|nr:inositol 1,4,5-trisphosphate receptor-interacting protein-like 1 [Tachyglossus aculeatus]
MRTASMALVGLLFLAVMAIVQRPLMVSDRLDVDTLARCRRLEKLSNREMRRLEREFEERRRPLPPPPGGAPGMPGKDGGGAGGRAPRTGDRAGKVSGWILSNLGNLGLLGLFLLFEVVRQNLQHGASFDAGSSDEDDGEEEDDDDGRGGEVEAAAATEPRLPEGLGSWLGDLPSSEALAGFLEQRLEASSRVRPGTCEFVESFVDDLLDACRGLAGREALLQLEDCLGLGAAYERWGPLRGPPRLRVLVPLLPPPGRALVPEPRVRPGAGRVAVGPECQCERREVPGDVLCLLHRPGAGPGPSPLEATLCSGRHLDRLKTVRWFSRLVAEAWARVAHKYDFGLSVLAPTTCCRLRLGYRSGRRLDVSVVLGVQWDESLVYLASREDGPAEGPEPPSGLDWPESCAACEQIFLKLVGRCAPPESCHLRCLQVLDWLRDPPGGSRPGPPVLTPYHLKTALMHQLLLLPLSAWKPELLSQRVRDVLSCLARGLRERRLPHFWTGNDRLPLTVPVPEALRGARPLNLFGHLERDPRLLARAVLEFRDLVGRVKAAGLRPPARDA